MEDHGNMNSYREMTVEQKLNRADELLKQYEGTDKYDAFKKRVDAMKHKYGFIARVAPDAKWNYDEVSQAVQKGLPDLRPNVQITGDSLVPDYDGVIAQRQDYLDWYSGRGWASRFVGNFGGQNERLATTAENSRDDIAYLQGMKNALGYAVANPERATALGTLVTPRQDENHGSPRKFVWNENLGQYTVVPKVVRVKPREEPVQEVQQDAKGGDSPGPETAVSETAVSEPVPEGYRGPRIVINPTTFHNKKDALCVAFNEAFRVVMEDMGFDPAAEPTDRQREFFSDTAYADDETQLRRTILARICTFDTSVKDPTDEQLQEAVEFLESVMESGYPQNEWEQSAVQRIHDVVARAVGAPRADEAPEAEPEPEPPSAPGGEGAVQAAEGAGESQESDDAYIVGMDGSDESAIMAAAQQARPTEAEKQLTQLQERQPQQPWQPAAGEEKEYQKTATGDTNRFSQLSREDRNVARLYREGHRTGAEANRMAGVTYSGIYTTEAGLNGATPRPNKYTGKTPTQQRSAAMVPEVRPAMLGDRRVAQDADDFERIANRRRKRMWGDVD